MTYKQLIEKLQKLPAARLNDNVTVWGGGNSEFIPATVLTVNNGNDGLVDTDVLDEGHPVIFLAHRNHDLNS